MYTNDVPYCDFFPTYPDPGVIPQYIDVAVIGLVVSFVSFLEKIIQIHSCNSHDLNVGTYDIFYYLFYR